MVITLIQIRQLKIISFRSYFWWQVNLILPTPQPIQWRLLFGDFLGLTCFVRTTSFKLRKQLGGRHETTAWWAQVRCHCFKLLYPNNSPFRLTTSLKLLSNVGDFHSIVYIRVYYFTFIKFTHLFRGKILFTKRERWLIFSSLKKSCFLKSALLVNFWFWWYFNCLNLLNILTMSNKRTIWWFWVNVTTSSQQITHPFQIHPLYRLWIHLKTR